MRIVLPVHPHIRTNGGGGGQINIKRKKKLSHMCVIINTHIKRCVCLTEAYVRALSYIDVCVSARKYTRKEGGGGGGKSHRNSTVFLPNSALSTVVAFLFVCLLLFLNLPPKMGL